MKFETMVRHANRRSTNKGFTLLELLLAVSYTHLTLPTILLV